MLPRRARVRVRRHSGTVPLDRALSKLGLASRTVARGLIETGRVRVDGRIVSNPRALVTPEAVRIAIDDIVRSKSAWTLLLFNKPRDSVTTKRDPQGRRTVFDVLGETGRGLVAVGRLDRASTGLLLFTNDTQLANWLTDPANAIVRTYLVTVRGRLSPERARAIEAGIDIEGERLCATRVILRKVSRRETHAIVTLDEGRNREIRRLFDAVGHEVTRLHRVAFGGLTLGRLEPGKWRAVTREELEAAIEKMHDVEDIVPKR